MKNINEIIIENNQLLKEIKNMLIQLLSPEHAQKQEVVNLLTNILANLLVYNQRK